MRGNPQALFGKRPTEKDPAKGTSPAVDFTLRGPWRSNAPGLPDERWFAEITAKLIRRGVHRSVADLQADITRWTEQWNDHPRPYVWTKTADQILESLATYCQRINDSGH